jgi:hypothetical protein
MGVSDIAVAIVLGMLLLVVVLGGVVWLDVGPVGRHGRALRDKQASSWPRSLRGWLTGKDPDDR